MYLVTYKFTDKITFMRFEVFSTVTTGNTTYVPECDVRALIERHYPLDGTCCLYKQYILRNGGIFLAK
jgi:hypothetical protein